MFESAGKSPQEKALVVREGEKDRHERIVLVATAPTATEPVPEAATVAPVETTTRHDGATQRMAGLVVGGVGAAGIVLGTVFGFVSKSTYDGALGHCTNRLPNECTQVGYDDGKSAHSQAAVSTVAFIAGGALLGTGVLLYFTAPKAGVTVSPSVGLASAGLDLRGSW
jgi:hypothetical protein